MSSPPIPTFIGDVDLHLINEGRHEQLWKVLGAHLRGYDGRNGWTSGTSFTVWAPSAREVRVIGDFNGWDGSQHPMLRRSDSGIWELFVADVGAGDLYQYAVWGADGVWRNKADPLATRAQRPPHQASVVDESTYEWSDDEWIERRASATAVREPLSIYEMHLGSWRSGLTYRALAEQLGPYVSDLGFTHVELMPVMEHPYGGSWGYQVSSYYAPSARWGEPDDLRYLIDQLHRAGIGVILDWVPAHFPRDDWALARFDGTPLYEHGDPLRGEHPEWGTYVFDFGRSQVRNFLVANALFWLLEFHADGLRVDAVASMLYLDYSRQPGQWAPNAHGGRENLEAVSFLQEVNATCYKHAPGIITVAEESTAWPGVTQPTSAGGLGFGLKWNMGWMHDSLLYLDKDPVHRQYHHSQMTFAMTYAHSENYVLPLSHDEVVHGKHSLLQKMSGDRSQQLAALRAFLGYMWAHPGKQLLFMGAELAQEREWDESGELDWDLLSLPGHRGMWRLVCDLNAAYKECTALWELDADPAGFSWIDANDTANNVFSFVRAANDGRRVACIANFAGTPHTNYRIGLPLSGRWQEFLNTDADFYGGSNVGNFGAVTATPKGWHGQPFSAVLQVPALATLWLRSA